LVVIDEAGMVQVPGELGDRVGCRVNVLAEDVGGRR